MFRCLMSRIVVLSVVLVIGLTVIGIFSAGGRTPQRVAAQSAVTPVAPAPTPTPLTLEQLSRIQPGLGTVMIEYGRRMAAVWWSGQAGNWDMAKYQIVEMLEIQEVGETTRPARAKALKGFESGFLEPLQKAVEAKDKVQFETAYKNAINGCNGCHIAQTSASFPSGYGFIKVQVPTREDSLDSIYAWK